VRGSPQHRFRGGGSRPALAHRKEHICSVPWRCYSGMTIWLRVHEFSDRPAAICLSQLSYLPQLIRNKIRVNRLQSG